MNDSKEHVGLRVLREMMEEKRKKLSEDARVLEEEIMQEARAFDAEEVHVLWIASKAETVKDEEQWKEGVEALKIIESEQPTFFPELMKIKDYERTWDGFKRSLKWTKVLAIGTIIIAITSFLTTIIASVKSCSHINASSDVIMKK